MLINIRDAKKNFSELINKTLQGEDIIIANNGKPLVRLIPYAEKTEKRTGGKLQGLIQISDDYDAPLPSDLLKLFHQI